MNELLPKSKNVREHILNYVQLFSKPVRAWKKAVKGKKKSGIDFVVLHLIYYVLLAIIYISFGDSSGLPWTAIGSVIIDVLLTLLPFSILIIPFLLSRYFFNHSYTVSGLFRLLIIIKLQGAPVALLLGALSYRVKIEAFFIVLLNAMFLIFIFYLVVPPIITRLRVWQKSLWLFMNYIFFVISMFLLTFFLDYSNQFDRGFSKIIINTPETEYMLFNDAYYNSIEQIRHDLYFACIADDTLEPNVVFTRFVTDLLKYSFDVTIVNERQLEIKHLISEINKIDKKKGDSIYQSIEFDKFKIPSKDVELTFKNLDFISNRINLIFMSDLALVDSVRRTAKFDKNREYANSIYNYMNAYRNSFIDKKSILKIVNGDGKDVEFIQLSDKLVGVMYRVDTVRYGEMRNEITELKNELDNNLEYANLTQRVVLYPIEIIYNWFFKEI